MDPIIIRVKPDARLIAVIALAVTGALLILFLKTWFGIVLVVAAAVLIYLLGRRAVLAYDAAVIVRGYVGSEKYRWSRIAGFASLETESGTIGVINLVSGEEVPLPMWSDPESEVLGRLNAEAKRRQQG